MKYSVRGDSERFNIADYMTSKGTIFPWRQADTSQTPITVTVMNSVEPKTDKNYETYVANGGILLGVLKRLQFTTDFKFTFMEFQDYGPYLNSVNDLFEDREKQTYWQLMVKKTDGKVIVLDVGIGCYIPDKDDKIILNYTKY